MWWLLLILYGLAFGFLSAIAVKRKNRDQTSWFFIGLFFGVFGLIAAMLVEGLEPDRDIRLLVPDHEVLPDFDPSTLTKKCPDCAETIKLEAIVCRFCRHTFIPDEVKQHLDIARREYDKLARLSERLH